MEVSTFLPDVPRHGQLQPLPNALGGRVTQQALRLADVGQAVAHVARAKVAVDELGALQMGVKRQQVAVQLGVQLVEGGAVAYGYVVDLVDGGWGALSPALSQWEREFIHGGGQQVGLHHVGNKAEVAAGFTVAVDIHRLALDQAGNPLRDDGGIGAVGVLPGAKHVEITQANGVKAVAAGKHVGIQLVDIFGHGVRRERLANQVFDLWQPGVIAVGRA